MPPRGVKPDSKRGRQYEEIKSSLRQRGRSEPVAEEIAARTVNKERARSGESRQRSRTSTQDKSSGQRGGERSGTNREKGRTRDQLYNEARKMGAAGCVVWSGVPVRAVVEALGGLEAGRPYMTGTGGEKLPEGVDPKSVIVERSVPALIAQPGQLKTSLLGMSFLNRLESWEVRGDKLMMRGTP